MPTTTVTVTWTDGTTTTYTVPGAISKTDTVVSFTDNAGALIEITRSNTRSIKCTS